MCYDLELEIRYKINKYGQLYNYNNKNENISSKVIFLILSKKFKELTVFHGFGSVQYANEFIEKVIEFLEKLNK